MVKEQEVNTNQNEKLELVFAHMSAQEHTQKELDTVKEHLALLPTWEELSRLTEELREKSLVAQNDQGKALQTSLYAFNQLVAERLRAEGLENNLTSLLEEQKDQVTKGWLTIFGEE